MRTFPRAQYILVDVPGACSAALVGHAGKYSVSFLVFLLASTEYFASRGFPFFVHGLATYITVPTLFLLRATSKVEDEPHPLSDIFLLLRPPFNIFFSFYAVRTHLSLYKDRARFLSQLSNILFLFPTIIQVAILSLAEFHSFIFYPTLFSLPNLSPFQRKHRWFSQIKTSAKMYYTRRAFSALLALAATVQAQNILTFVSTDNFDRTVVITPSAGIQGVDPVSVPAGQTVVVNLVHGFIGNAYAYKTGGTNAPGMLAEVNFNGWNGLTYFDVSAIVNSADTDNVREMYPAAAPNSPQSGCNPFPCNNAYYLPDDIQTKSTDQTNLIVTLGSGSANSTTAATKREAEDDSKTFARNMVERDY